MGLILSIRSIYYMTTVTTKAPKQVAINDIGSADDFLAAVEKTLKFFNDGDLIEGTVVKIDRDEVLLDVGYKTEGVIPPSRELSIKHDVDPSEVVEVGDTVEALVLQKEDKEGRLILSKKRAQYERAWGGDVEKIKESDGVVTGSVIEVVKGGLIVDIGLRGFLPASLIELRRVRDLTPYLGQEIEAKILELDKNRNNVVLSRRALLEQTQSESRSTFLANLHPGQVRKGVISSIVNFGAFVDLGGGVDGLVHVSELSWKHIEHASEVVEVGQEVTVEVLSVELDRERVSLSLKATQEDPWQVFARTHAIGQVAPARSRSSFRSARSSVSQTASRVSFTSPSCPPSTSSSPSRSCRSAKRSSSRSSTSTSSVAASRSRSSRRTRASTPRAPSSTRRSTACSRSTTSRATTSSPPRLRPPRDERVARRLRGCSRGMGAGVRCGPGSLGGPQEAGRFVAGRSGRRRLVLVGTSSFSSDAASSGTLADDASLAALREKLSSNN